MYFLIQNAPIRWPDRARHGIDVSPEAQDLISRVSKCQKLFKNMNTTIDAE